MLRKQNNKHRLDYSRFRIFSSKPKIFQSLWSGINGPKRIDQGPSGSILSRPGPIPGPELFKNLGRNQNQKSYENLGPIRSGLAVHGSLLIYSMGWRLYMKWAMNGNLKFEIEISVSGRNIWYGRVLRGKVERRLNLVKDWSHKTFLKVDKILFKTFQNFFAF